MTGVYDVWRCGSCDPGCVILCRAGVAPVDRCCMSSADCVDLGDVYIPEWDRLVPLPDEAGGCGGSCSCRGRS